MHSLAAFHEREATKIDLLLAKARSAIACLKEYRTALISPAVTGKIDVREEHRHSGASRNPGMEQA